MFIDVFLFGAASSALLFLLFYFIFKSRRLENEKEELIERVEFITKVAYELKEQLEKEKN